MAEIKRLVISDAGPIIHLDELDCLNLLNFPEVLIPESVFQEINNIRIIQFSKFPNFKIVSDPEIPTEILESYKIYDLHKGEAMAISLVLESKDAILLTDDSAARLFAVNLKMSVHGTIGILLRAVRMKLFTPQAMIEILSNIRTKSTLHISQKLIDESIAAIQNI